MKGFSFFSSKSLGRVWPGFMIGLWIVSAGFSGCTPANSGDTVRFNVGEGLAVDTLKEAARQADVEFIFSSELVGELRTPALTGNYTPSDAFGLLLADSPFVVVQHQESGVYSIQRSSHQ